MYNFAGLNTLNDNLYHINQDSAETSACYAVKIPQSSKQFMVGNFSS